MKNKKIVLGKILGRGNYSYLGVLLSDNVRGKRSFISLTPRYAIKSEVNLFLMSLPY